MGCLEFLYAIFRWNEQIITKACKVSLFLQKESIIWSDKNISEYKLLVIHSVSELQFWQQFGIFNKEIACVFGEKRKAAVKAELNFFHGSDWNNSYEDVSIVIWWSPE